MGKVKILDLFIIFVQLRKGLDKIVFALNQIKSKFWWEQFTVQWVQSMFFLL